MVRPHPILTACALGLLLPTAATAGPIGWEVSAQLARVGNASGPWSWGLTPEFIGGGSTIHEQTFSRLAAEGPHAGWGSQSFRVGSLFPDGPSYDPLHGAPGTFEVTVALTDRGSGQAGTVVFAGFGWEVLEQDYDRWGVLLSRRSVAELRGDTEQPLTLGGNEYAIGLRAVERGGIVDFFADVSVGDAIATPEPGTLALAALGLGAIGFRRRYRRGAVAVVALLLAPQLASAGPLGWDIRAVAPDGTVLREVTGLTAPFYDDLFLADPQYHGVFSRVTHPQYRTDVWETEARVTITDAASGASGEFRLWWQWVKEYDRRPDGSEEQFYEGYSSGPWPDPLRLTLGGNVYEVRGPGGELRVTVEPAVATPEPNTLALAGLGLGVVGVLRRRTNRRASHPLPKVSL